MGLKLRSIFIDCTSCCTAFSNETVVISGFNVFISGIQNVFLSAFLFINYFPSQESQYNSTSDPSIPHGLSSLIGYLFNPKISVLVPQPVVNSNAQRSIINFGPQVVANKIINLKFLDLSV